MGELVKLAEWRHLAAAKRHLAVGDKCIVRQLHAIAKIQSGLSTASLSPCSMLGSHGLMLRQTERELTKQPPTKPVA
jgi:hypothetical protein